MNEHIEIIEDELEQAESYMKQSSYMVDCGLRLQRYAGACLLVDYVECMINARAHIQMAGLEPIYQDTVERLDEEAEQLYEQYDINELLGGESL
ncbi:hypothetical protein ACFR99_18870 [Haloarchaeobius amylolyticus]|uniref:Uncharacterized protein n=1 Tax=Haloarchaeobius amylolyticus TaxID=1198296 RepID=A0ABD6BKG5_9EURY